MMNANAATSVGCGGYLFSFSWLGASVTNLEEEARILDDVRSLQDSCKSPLSCRVSS